MRLFFFTLLSAVFFSCADNPLLEQRLSEVEAAQEEDRLSLLARLDALAVTVDNADEIGNVRAKLNQTTITRSEFEDLQERVEELEGQIGDWSGIVHSLQYSVYAVLHGVYNENIGDCDYYVYRHQLCRRKRYACYQWAHHRWAARIGRPNCGIQQQVWNRPTGDVDRGAKPDDRSVIPRKLFLH